MITRRFLFLAALLLCADSALASDAKSIAGLRDALAALSPSVAPAEAESLSLTAHTSARELARAYRVVRPPEFQNFLIHIGVRRRGYCFQWAHDIGLRLKSLGLRTLDLHWAAAEVGTPGEHNCIVVPRAAGLSRPATSSTAGGTRAAYFGGGPRTTLTIGRKTCRRRPGSKVAELARTPPTDCANLTSLRGHRNNRVDRFFVGRPLRLSSFNLDNEGIPFLRQPSV